MSAAAVMLATLALSPPVFGHAPLPDSALADLRGGIMLPNGIEAALTIETQTAINGALVLMTVFKIDTGAPQMAVFAPAEGTSVPAQHSASPNSGSQGLPTISFDTRDRLQVVAPAGGTPFVVFSGERPANSGRPPGMVQIDAASPVETSGGRVSLTGSGKLQAVEFAMPDLQVLHLAGQAFGSVIANSGSERAIDTQTVVSLDLSRAGPDLIGSTMLRVADVASEAMSMRY